MSGSFAPVVSLLVEHDERHRRYLAEDTIPVLDHLRRHTTTAHRKLTAAWRANQPDTQSPANAGVALLSEEQDPASDDFEETEVHRSNCYCRVCQADLELIGRLKGTETKAMQSLAQAILFRMLSFFNEVATVAYNELMLQLRIAWLTPKFLPRPIRDLFIGRARLTSLECGVLEAFVIEELHKSTPVFGSRASPPAEPDS